ncbi:hypothetical protein Afil01_45830 [Actinorhabdospora filicis]|uniref:N-acetyltransferase domain-containing protein n=1 Tax=Actinorhabdospora filicis TaxID=1785913 RepID=A0A9W6WBP4_9ACTN|nr:GNAT family N-acetyltransferase [Actinorhabdospora filicis]GLZ79776.1 hypothetical protein Afil01_45830 [Actinorhabdospora filicis]
MIENLGPDVLAHGAQLREVYTEAFSGPPWGEDPTETARWWERATADVRRPGFRAVVARGERVDGFGFAWTTAAPFPRDRAYRRVLDLLGEDGVARHLVGALEVDELAVRPSAQGTGLGRRLLAELVGERPAWLLTARKAVDTVAFYDRVGWRRAPALPGQEENPVIVFLSPQD